MFGQSRPPTRLTNLRSDEFKHVLFFVTDANDLCNLLATGDALCVRLVQHGHSNRLHIYNHHDKHNAEHTPVCHVLSSLYANRRGYRSRQLTTRGDHICSVHFKSCTVCDVADVVNTVLDRPPVSKPNNLLRFLSNVNELVIHPFVHHLNEYFPLESGPSIAKLVTLVLHGPTDGCIAKSVYSMMLKLVSGGNNHVFPVLETLCLIGDDDGSRLRLVDLVHVEQEMFPSLLTLIVRVQMAVLGRIPKSVKTVMARMHSDSDWRECTGVTTVLVTGASSFITGTHSYVDVLSRMPPSLTALVVSTDPWSSSGRVTQFDPDLFMALAPRGLETLSFFIPEDMWENAVYLKLKVAYKNVQPNSFNAWECGLAFLIEQKLILLPTLVENALLPRSSPPRLARAQHSPIHPSVDSVDIHDTQTSLIFQKAAMERVPGTVLAASSVSTLVKMNVSGRASLGAVFSLIHHETKHHSAKGVMFLTSETRRVSEIASESIQPPTCLFPCLEQCSLSGLMIDLCTLKSVASNRLKSITLLECALVLPHASKYLDADTRAAGSSTKSPAPLVMLTPNGEKDDAMVVSLPNRRPDQRGTFTNIAIRMSGVVAKCSSRQTFRSVGVNHVLAPYSFANVARLMNLVFRTNNGFLVFETSPFLTTASSTIADVSRMSASFKSYFSAQENVNYDYLLD